MSKFKARNYLECKKCNDLVYSRYSGEYRECNCGAVYVDETEYYCRISGDTYNWRQWDKNHPQVLDTVMLNELMEADEIENTKRNKKDWKKLSSYKNADLVLFIDMFKALSTKKKH